jgi:putative addiction module CopG family antidote
MTISLPAELEKAIDRKVESGLYSDPSDVIREALRQSLAREIDENRLRNEAAIGFRQLDEGRSIAVNNLEEFIVLVRENP